MTGEALRVHAHPTYKIGVRPADPARVHLRVQDLVTHYNAALVLPPQVDDTAGVTFGLDDNDRFGDCVPTGYDNLRRLITRLLTGTQVSATQDQVFAWYATQNPGFRGVPGEHDDGMVIADFLDYLVQTGEILAYAKIDPTNEAEVRAGIYLFGGLIAGVDLQIAQQSQTDAGTWDYQRSGEWGGHCVIFPAYEGRALDDVITWAQRVKTTAAFRTHQLQELFVVVRPEHLQNAGFRQGIDLAALGAWYRATTGQTLPNWDPTPPAPGPTPDPGPTPGPTPDPVPPTPPGPDPVLTEVETILKDLAAHLVHTGKAIEAWLKKHLG